LHATTDYVVRFSCFICPDHPPRERWFTALPADLATRSHYTVPTQALVLSLVVAHKMSLVHAADFGRTHFHLDGLTPSTVMRWLRDGCPTDEMLAERERALVERFSGQLAFDEVYSGGKALLKATDPIVGVEVAYEFVDGPVDHAAIVAFFRRLETRGFQPQIVVTDGASVYPAAIAEVWPKAKHQSCVFHFLQTWTKLAMKAFWHCYGLMPTPEARGPGRPKKRGRRRMDKLKLDNRDIVRRARYLFLTRPENLTEEQEGRMRAAIQLYPALGTLRELVLAVYGLFGPDVRDVDTARARRAAILSEYKFGLPFLEPLLRQLRDEAVFDKLIVALAYENAERTTNHVERQNREYRKRQKSHYRLRTRRSEDALLGFLLFLPRAAPRKHPVGRQKLERRLPPPATTNSEVAMAN
ncbi:MAG: transposase, partial [Acidimicrobiales bacterium]